MSKTGYHHGNLRQALVEAAVDVLAKESAGTFTLARAAKAAGVTPAAVYRHFKGRDDLLAEVARQGHERLALLTSNAVKAPDAAKAALDYGAAFELFARSYPAHFAAIHLSGLPPHQTQALAVACAQSDAVLMQIARRISESADMEQSAEDIAKHLHALCRGMVQITSENNGYALRSALAIYLKGVGLSPSKLATK